MGRQRLGCRLGWVEEWYSRKIDWLKQTECLQNHETLGYVSEPGLEVAVAGMEDMWRSGGKWGYEESRGQIMGIPKLVQISLISILSPVASL